MSDRAIRDALGITDLIIAVANIHNHVENLEAKMATAAEQLTDLKAAFSDFSADVDAKLDQLLEAQQNLNPDAQAVFDELKAAVQAADERVGDADGSDTPAPAEPTDGQPA